MTGADATSSQGSAGKLAVVTGGSRGIGLAVARALARQGYRLLLGGRDGTALERALDGLSAVPGGGGAETHTAQRCDVREPESVRGLFAEAAALGGLEVVVNSAGLAHAPADVAALSLATWHDALDTNLTGTFLCCRAAVPLLARGGTIVNVASVAAGREVFAGQAAYAASKAGVLALTNTLRAEVRGRGIRVVALVPGATDTPIWDALWPDAPRERMMAADSVADALVAALLLPAGATVTELVVEPTGGRL
jgi:NAD(P)-dependent dehydrogenase (short-subunit alcohol dehydrogenase family)